MGKYPMLDEKTSLEVLKSSVEAYNYGQGEWPTMSVWRVTGIFSEE